MRRPFDWFHSKILLRQSTGLNFVWNRSLGLLCYKDGKARKAATTMSPPLDKQTALMWAKLRCSSIRTCVHWAQNEDSYRFFGNQLSNLCCLASRISKRRFMITTGWHRGLWALISVTRPSIRTFRLRGWLYETRIVPALTKGNTVRFFLVGQSHFLQCRQWSVTQLCLPHNEKQAL